MPPDFGAVCWTPALCWTLPPLGAVCWTPALCWTPPVFGAVCCTPALCCTDPLGAACWTPALCCTTPPFGAVWLTPGGGALRSWTALVVSCANAPGAIRRLAKPRLATSLPCIDCPPSPCLLAGVVVPCGATRSVSICGVGELPPSQGGGRKIT